MRDTFRKILSISLVCCVFIVGGLAQAHSEEHIEHHTQHQAATHGTVLCSWMCTAGTVIDTAVVLIVANHTMVTFLSLPQAVELSIEPCRISPSRAPPAFSL